MQVACLPTSLMTAAFEGSKVCQIYQEKGRGETTFDILPYSIWSFPGPRRFDVKMVKQQKKRVITIQLPCNTHSSLKDWRFRLLFQSQDWQIQQLFDNGTQKNLLWDQEKYVSISAILWTCPTGKEPFHLFSNNSPLEIFKHFTSRKVSLKINEF